MIFDPVPSATQAAEPVISTPAANPVANPIGAIRDAVEGSVVIPGAEGASNSAKPVVDPTAFVIKSN